MAPVASVREKENSSKVNASRGFRVSDASGAVEFTSVNKGALQRGMLDTKDVFVVDAGPEIFGKVMIINYSVTLAGLEDQEKAERDEIDPPPGALRVSLLRHQRRALAWALT